MVSMWLLILLLLLLFVFYIQRRHKMKTFEQMNIPGPKPHFLFGNLLSFFRKSFFIKYQEWYQEYGDLFGYFEGPTPVLVTSNLDMIHEIFVKQFKNFHARKVFPVQVDPEKDQNVHMFFALGERWRRLRSIANPAFSTAKMRTMAPMINKRIDHLVGVVENHSRKDEDFDAYEVFQRLTLDTIAECGFGLQSNSLRDPEDEWLRNCRGVIKDTTKRPLLFLCGFVFPKFHDLWIAIYKFLGYFSFNPVFWLEDKVDKIVNDRKQNRQVDQTDLLDILLKSEFDPNNPDSLEQLDPNDNVVRKRLLTTGELTSQCLLFLLSGYETTSTTLAYLMYEMAVNPKVQKTLQMEIDKYFPEEDEEPTYDALQKMEYLDMVWRESLRKYPLASTVVARSCVNDCTIEGVPIKKGMLIHANVWAIHYSQPIWGEDPKLFIPERFTQERMRQRHPMAWLPFGNGPRSCVGLRLAQLEGKMSIVRLFKKFTFVPSTFQDIPLKLIEGATIVPQNGVHVRAIRRK